MARHKTLDIYSISPVEYKNDINIISLELDKLERNKIKELNWFDFNYAPKVSFAVGYNEDSLFLKYFVEEEHCKAVYSKINEPVYKDSCVEFFISFGNDENYYNLEINCLGTCLIEYGPNRHEREFLSKKLIKKINTQTTLKKENNFYKWEITLAIPFDVFCFTELAQLKGKSAKANLYKCGDDLPVPHYLTWNPIDTPSPDFHRPEYFGTLNFV